MITFCLDTSSEATFIGLINEEKSLFRKLETVGSHSEAVAPAVSSLFQLVGVPVSQISRIILGIGPGSFTGLRIGASFCTGLMSGGDVDELYAISSFEIFTAGIISYNNLTQAVIHADARREEVYVFGVKEDLSTEVVPLDIYPKDFLLSQDETSRDVSSILSEEFEAGVTTFLSRIVDGTVDCKKVKRFNTLSISTLELLYVRPASARTIEEREGEKNVNTR